MIHYIGFEPMRTIRWVHSYLKEKEKFRQVPQIWLKYFTDRSKAVLLLWIFYVFVLSCVCYVLRASVYMCFVVTCWERADLLALVCGVFCEFVTFPLVSWVMWYLIVSIPDLCTITYFFFHACSAPFHARVH